MDKQGVEGDEEVSASTNSFWDVGNYRKVLERMDNGARLCDDLHRMLQERSEIELKYAKSLKIWKKRWEEIVDKGPDYGTSEKAWVASLTAAESIADIHAECKDKITTDVMPQIVQWKKEHYHKSLMSWKETKTAEDGFERAQKPWEKRLGKVQRARKSYHTSCRTAEVQNRAVADAERDPSVTTDQCKKLKTKADKLSKERQKAEDKYRERVQDITLYNETYKTDMTREFEKCQEFEGERLAFFKKIFLQSYGILDLSAVEAHTATLKACIAGAEHLSPDQDLGWYSKAQGTEMGMQWPVFEEFKEVDEMAKSQVSTRRYDGRARDSVTSSATNVSNSGPTSVASNAHDKAVAVVSADSADDFDSCDPPAAAGEGVPVRALFDYDAQDDDELSFKAGDVLTKTEEEDEQGWCRGILGEKEGLFPANYCGPI